VKFLAPSVLLAAAGALPAGCAPHATRPLSEREAGVVERMCLMIHRVAAESGSATVGEVAEALDGARRAGDVLVYDDPPGPAGDDALTVRSRVYLRERLLREEGRRFDEEFAYALRLFYHEGVHLTQSWCTLTFSPGRAEEEAKRETSVFGDYARLYRQRIYRDDR